VEKKKIEIQMMKDLNIPRGDKYADNLRYSTNNSHQEMYSPINIIQFKW
jgi:hypothetical protein